MASPLVLLPSPLRFPFLLSIPLACEQGAGLGRGRRIWHKKTPEPGRGLVLQDLVIYFVPCVVVPLLLG